MCMVWYAVCGPWCMVWGGAPVSGEVVYRNNETGEEMESRPTLLPCLSGGIVGQRRGSGWVFIDADGAERPELVPSMPEELAGWELDPCSRAQAWFGRNVVSGEVRWQSTWDAFSRAENCVRSCSGWGSYQPQMMCRLKLFVGGTGSFGWSIILTKGVRHLWKSLSCSRR